MRNFPNFLEAYMQYARDEFCPPQFHTWTGLSILAGALERKVWVNIAGENLFPNIYVLLVSHPAEGKSTALKRGVRLLEHLHSVHNTEFKIIPTQTTEAALVDQMKVCQSFQQGSIVVQYSSGYFYASEASDSAFKNEHGNFNATLNEFYDCPDVFRKKIMANNAMTEIHNISFNLLAATTFDFLKKMVNEESALGGLASRFIYVLEKERSVKYPKWEATYKRDARTSAALATDLAEINKLIGKFKPTPGFIKLWENYQPEFHKSLIELNSPRMESINSRKSTNLTKICMLLSIAAGDSLDLNEGHWEEALRLVDDVTKDNAHILSSAIIAKVDTQAGLNQLILQTVRKSGGRMPINQLRSIVARQGSDLSKFDVTFKFLCDAGHLKIEVSGNSSNVKLLVNPDSNL